MAGKKLRGDRHKDNFDITTTDVTEPADGTVEKRSRVHVDATDNHKEKDLWVGLKIDARQKVLGLVVDGKTWATRRTGRASDAADQFTRVFGQKPGEKWVAYVVDRRLKPGRPDFQTSLTLDRRVASDPDAQIVTIGVCYVPDPPDALNREAILLGHSLVQAPPGARRTRKRTTRARRRPRR